MSSIKPDMNMGKEENIIFVNKSLLKKRVLNIIKQKKIPTPPILGVGTLWIFCTPSNVSFVNLPW